VTISPEAADRCRDPRTRWGYRRGEPRIGGEFVSDPVEAESSRGRTGMTALAACSRDLQIALRVGGGALIGVLSFSPCGVLMPFAVSGPDLALLARWGRRYLWLGALLQACSRSTGCSPPTTRMVRSI